jgi:hypothetical protein
MITLALPILMMGQVFVPPSLPSPNTGEIHCTLRSEQDDISKLDGLIFLPESRLGGKHDAQLIFKSDKVPELSRKYEAYWTSSGARFLNVEGNSIVDITIVTPTPTVFPTRAAIAVAIKPIVNMSMKARYYSGFCTHNLSYDRGKDQP